MKSFSRLLIRRFVSVFPFLILVPVWNCKPNEPYVYICHDGLINYEKVEILQNFQNIISPKDSLVTLVIRSDEDYRNHIADRQLKIDFNTKTLLAGRIRTPMAGYVAKQSVKKLLHFK